MAVGPGTAWHGEGGCSGSGDGTVAGVPVPVVPSLGWSHMAADPGDAPSSLVVYFKANVCFFVRCRGEPLCSEKRLLST